MIKRSMLVAVIMMVAILSGCSSKEPEVLAVPKVENTPPVVATEQPKEEIEEVKEEPKENEVKAEKLGIIGAWQTTFQGSSLITIFREDGTASIIYGDNQSTDVLPNTPSDLLYDVEEVGEDTYKITFYNVMIDCTDPAQNIMVDGAEFDIMTISIIDENTFQNTYKWSSEFFNNTRVNTALAESMMGTTLFSDNGYKSVDVAVNYLKLQDPSLRYIEYQGAYGDNEYREFFTYSTTFGGTQITWYYVNTKDLRLFTESEYYNIVQP